MTDGHGKIKRIIGAVLKFERNKFYSDNILIEMNMLFDMNGIFKNKSGESFKDLFDIVSKNKEYAELIINDEIKYKLVNLYKKYGISFDTLLVGNDIYIRFLVGDLFKVEDVRFSIVDEKRFKKDYYMLKNVVQIAEEIDKIF